MPDINSVFNDIHNYKNDLVEKLKYDVINSVISELQYDYDAYISELKKLPLPSREALTEKYNLSSLEKINIISDMNNNVITISADRIRDARILEYIYGKRTPVQSILAKICSRTSMMSLLKKWSK